MTGVDPWLVGADAGTTVALTGVVASPWTYVAFVSASSGDCAVEADRRNEWLHDDNSGVGAGAGIPIFDTAMWSTSEVYKVCVKVEAGFVEQAAPGVNLTVMAAEATSLVVAPEPAMVGVQTSPSIRFAGAAFATGTAGVALAETASCTGLLYAASPFGATTDVVDLVSPVPALGVGGMFVCYAVNFNVGSPTWVLQSGISLGVVTAGVTGMSWFGWGNTRGGSVASPTCRHSATFPTLPSLSIACHHPCNPFIHTHTHAHTHTHTRQTSPR